MMTMAITMGTMGRSRENGRGIMMREDGGCQQDDKPGENDRNDGEEHR